MTADTQIASPDILSLHRRALQSTRQFVAGIGPRAWTDATPCDDWDVRALLNHVVVGNLWAAELVVGHTIEDVGNRLDGDRLGAAPLDDLKASGMFGSAPSGPTASDPQIRLLQALGRITADSETARAVS